jgi:hypothetical protein
MLWEAMQLSFRRREPKKDVPGTRKDNAITHQFVTFAYPEPLGQDYKGALPGIMALTRLRLMHHWIGTSASCSIWQIRTTYPGL